MATLPRQATDGARLVEHLPVLDAFGEWPAPLQVFERAEIVLTDRVSTAYVAGRTKDGRVIYSGDASRQDLTGQPRAINYATFRSVSVDDIVAYHVK